MFSKDGVFRTVHFESVVGNFEKYMLTPQYLLRSRPKWNWGTVFIFWYKMDEQIHFWCRPALLPSTSSPKRVYHFQILGLRCYRKRQTRRAEEPRDIQSVEPKSKVSSIESINFFSNSLENEIFRIQRLPFQVFDIRVARSWSVFFRIGHRDF